MDPAAIPAAQASPEASGSPASFVSREPLESNPAAPFSVRFERGGSVMVLTTPTTCERYFADGRDSAR